MFLADVEIKRISAKALEGGSATLTLTGSANIHSDDARDLTDLLVREDVFLTLTPPKAKVQTDADTGDASNDPDGAQDEAA